MRKLRNLIVIGALSGLFLLPSSGEAHTRIYLRFGPPHLRTVKVVKPPRPYRNVVWISGHWVYKRGRFVWVNGYWVKARRNYVYVAAHWKKTPRGWYFVPGHWVKK
ncbi:MAG: hypothetical protein ACE5IW_05215 [bacterium]